MVFLCSLDMFIPLFLHYFMLFLLSSLSVYRFNPYKSVLFAEEEMKASKEGSSNLSKILDLRPEVRVRNWHAHLKIVVHCIPQYWFKEHRTQSIEGDLSIMHLVWVITNHK